jgi:hypothetical protein
VVAQNSDGLHADLCALGAKTYTRFLWATLWITMFTSRQTRANAGVAGGASELTSGPIDRLIDKAAKRLMQRKASRLMTRAA